MLKWLRNLGKRQDIHIYVHVDGALNVERQEAQERKPGSQDRDSAYFIPKDYAAEQKGPEFPVGREIGDISIPETDFGHEES